MNQDELQEFLADNVNADVPVDIQNQMMTDATALDFASFQKKWDKYLQDNSEGWSKLRASTKTTKERVKEAFGNDIPSDNWLFEMHAKELSDIPIEDVRAAIVEIGKEKEAADEKQKLADEYKKEAEARYARQKAVDDYQHQYGIPILDQFGIGPKMDVDNPINKGLNWLADQIISDKTKRAVVEDPNNTGRALANVGVDVVGTGVDFLPGVGGIVVGPALRAGRDIAEYEEGDPSIAGELVKDIGGNLILSKGLKGIPGVNDIGAIHAVEKKLDDLGEWTTKVKTATAKDMPKLEFPPVAGTKKEMREWVEKQPSQYRKRYYAELEKGADADLGKVFTELMGEDVAFETKRGLAKQWVRENPKKAAVGKTYPNVITGVEKTALHEYAEPESQRLSNPKKIKTYDDAIGFIIDTNKRQWEAGFKPRDMSGIVGDAYRKWESER